MFVGIRVPGDIATSLAGFRSTCPDALSGARWTDIGDLHITLKYLGPQIVPVAASIADGLAKISQPQVEIALNGAGVFEDVGVLFISIVPAPVLMRLQQAVDQVALANGVSCSEHPYKPHISIARFNRENVTPHSKTELLDQMSSQLSEYCQKIIRPHFRATEMTLFKSVSGHYKELYNFPLSE